MKTLEDEVRGRTLKESEFQKAVIEYAHLKGWMVAHFRTAQTEGRWMTAVGADGAGFPDLCMVRGDTIIFAELKVGKNKLSARQVEWMRRLRATGASTFEWWPEDWKDIELVLA